MNDLKFTAVTAENRAAFHELMQMYAKELDENQHRNTDSEQLRRWTDRIIEKQHGKGHCLKLCCKGAESIGFLYGKIDQPEGRGYKRVGHGYIMEFYVLPEHRRKGLGRAMLSHLESFFAENGAKQLYLTADPVTGKPFWEAMGFINTGEICPDNGQEIYEKALPPENVTVLHVQKAEAKDAAYIAMIYEDNILTLHGTVISSDEWRDALLENDKDEAHFLIYRDVFPVAWLKINGLSEGDNAWISMLAVVPKFQKQGIGEYAVRYAEEYCMSYGKKKLFVKTTMDNAPAQKLYQKCGYTVCDKTVYATSDGIDRNGIVFQKAVQ